jgi:hypothetical protein
VVVFTLESKSVVATINHLFSRLKLQPFATMDLKSRNVATKNLKINPQIEKLYYR